MTALDIGFAHVAGTAKTLKIVEVDDEFGVRLHRFNVIDFQMTAGAALSAFKAVSTLRLKAHIFPLRVLRDEKIE